MANSGGCYGIHSRESKYQLDSTVSETSRNNEEADWFSSSYWFSSQPEKIETSYPQSSRTHTQKFKGNLSSVYLIKYDIEQRTKTIKSKRDMINTNWVNVHIRQSIAKQSLAQVQFKNLRSLSNVHPFYLSQMVIEALFYLVGSNELRYVELYSGTRQDDYDIMLRDSMTLARMNLIQPDNIPREDIYKVFELYISDPNWEIEIMRDFSKTLSDVAVWIQNTVKAAQILADIRISTAELYQLEYHKEALIQKLIQLQMFSNQTFFEQIPLNKNPNKDRLSYQIEREVPETKYQERTIKSEIKSEIKPVNSPQDESPENVTTKWNPVSQKSRYRIINSNTFKQVKSIPATLRNHE